MPQQTREQPARLRLGLDIAQQRLTWAELLGRARLAETLGFDGVWGFDHFKALYGEGPGPCFEGMTTLAGLAAATSKVRLGLLVTGMTYRHPSVLAAEAVTVDHISGGRLELAVGAAWFEQEHQELGIDFPPLGERMTRLEEGVEVLQLLMSGDEASFSGRVLRLEVARYLPRPVQRPHPPIWIGGSGERRTLPLVARRADFWHTYGSLEVLRRKSALVDRLAEEAGRDPASIGRSTTISLSEDLDDVVRHVHALFAAGFTYLVCSWPTEGAAQVERFMERARGAFAAYEVLS